MKNETDDKTETESESDFDFDLKKVKKKKNYNEAVEFGPSRQRQKPQRK